MSCNFEMNQRYALEISNYFAHGDVTIVTLYSVVASSTIILISSLYYYNRRYNIKNVQKQKYDGHNNNNKPLYRCDNSADRFFVKKVFVYLRAFHNTYSSHFCIFLIKQTKIFYQQYFHCVNHQRHLMVISCDKKMMMDNVPRSCQIKKKPYRCRRHQMESVVVEVEFQSVIKYK